ncbi:hypothetical protein GEO21_22825, partial [Sphingobacterium faecium]|uniref:SIR2 family NAD-dependent protein deacylase n=1 Tax=Sphingobacterium faecium TaxID=34087 RepID=UPI001360154A
SDIDSEKYKSFLPVLNAGLMTPLEILDKLEDESHTIKKYIKNNFKVDRSCDFSLHEKILELTKNIITTNYDNAFEFASKNTIDPTTLTSTLNVSEINKSNEPYIFKIHGTYAESDNCIIFKKDYENLYSKTTPTIEKLKSIFTEKTILFIGFGFNDPDINLVFNNLDKLFKNNNKHYILTTEPDHFKDLNFLNSITLNDYNEIELYIDNCLKLKIDSKKNVFEVKQTLIKDKIRRPKLAYLVPDPIDIELDSNIKKVIDCFQSLDIQLFCGSLNTKSLELLDDYDLVIIVSSTYKFQLYIEDDNLKNNLMSASEICDSIPNEQLPIIFITDVPIELPENYKTINVATLKTQNIKRFIFKAFRGNNTNFENSEYIVRGLNEIGSFDFNKGNVIISSLYGNNKTLEIGRKSLSSVIGRIEEQA